jgi:hypothetical protein
MIDTLHLTPPETNILTDDTPSHPFIDQSIGLMMPITAIHQGFIRVQMCNVNKADNFTVKN